VEPLRSFVFTLGFHEDFAIRRLASKAARRGEPILVLTAKPAVGAVQKAFNSLREFCLRVGLEEPRLAELDLSDGARALVEARALIGQLPGLIVADVSGGSRMVVVVAILALLALGREYELYVASETGAGFELHVPAGVSRALSRLSEEKRAILAELSRSPGATAEELARRLGRAQKTVRNHLAELKKAGLVTARGGGGFELTSWGRAIAGAPASGREGS
jgi:CRISPR-associated protein Csa3